MIAHQRRIDRQGRYKRSSPSAAVRPRIGTSRYNQRSLESVRLLGCEMKLRETLLLEGDRFDVVRLEYEVRGKAVSKEIIRHNGAVVIAGRLNDGRLLLIDNYRPSIDRMLLELPAGTRSEGEEPLATAKREFLEETGYEAATWELLTEFYVSPGVMDEKMYLFLASDLKRGEQKLEPDELIELRPKTPSELRDALLAGQIEDAKTLIGVTLFLARTEA
ncbi:MAG TPA: NUDIX hydrolase [Pirellulaceae bacterium]|nr:NUDIX hydrolase [Pirellulaceae bacterium]